MLQRGRGRKKKLYIHPLKIYGYEHSKIFCIVTKTFGKRQQGILYRIFKFKLICTNSYVIRSKPLYMIFHSTVFFRTKHIQKLGLNVSFKR